VDVTQINSPRSIDLQERGAQDERSERNQTATHPTAYIDTRKTTQNQNVQHQQRNHECGDMGDLPSGVHGTSSTDPTTPIALAPPLAVPWAATRPIRTSRASRSPNNRDASRNHFPLPIRQHVGHEPTRDGTGTDMGILRPHAI
jgi:hypothetical protein